MKAILILPVILAACGGSTEPTNTAWQAKLTPVDARISLTARLAATSGADRTRADIHLEDAQAGATYRWLLRNGTCGQPGDIIGGRAVYPPLTPDNAGFADAEAVTAQTLKAAGDYQASLMDTLDAVIACGRLVRQ